MESAIHGGYGYPAQDLHTKGKTWALEGNHSGKGQAWGLAVGVGAGQERVTGWIASPYIPHLHEIIKQ